MIYYYQEMELPKFTCKRCGHKWTPRIEKVRVCPHCKNPYWNIERKQNKNAN